MSPLNERSVRSGVYSWTMRKLIPPIAGTLLTVAFELSLERGWFSSIPDVLVTVFWFIPACLWLYWWYTHEEVKKRIHLLHSNPMTSFLAFVCIGGSLGASAGALGWWSLKKQHDRQVLKDSQKPDAVPQTPPAHTPAGIEPTPPAKGIAKKDEPELSEKQSGVSQQQLEEIKQLDAIFSGLEETDLRRFFGFEEMVYLNMKMYQARVKHFKETSDRSFDISPYVQGQQMLLDTTIAGEHLHHIPGGGGYDFDPSQIAFVVLPPKYSDNKKLLLRYENSSLLPTSVVVRVKDFDDTLQENATQLIRVMNASLKENPDNFLYYDDVGSQYWNAVSSRYWREFRNLRPKADQIRDVCRKFLDVH